jgi:predicted phage terminase large subunit-like protein
MVMWGRYYLPQHFRSGPSQMHRWLAQQLARLRAQRGLQLNLVGPRGGAKSTLATLAFVLRQALEGSEPYIWIASDTRHQACAHLENIKLEISENTLLARDYSSAGTRGKLWRAGKIGLVNGVMIEAFGTGQRIRGYRFREHRPTLIICDDIQNDAHMASAQQRELSRRWFYGTLLKAGTRRTNVIHLGTALHADAIAMELLKKPGWQSKVFSAIESWPRHMNLWAQWEQIYASLDDPRHAERACEFYRQHQASMDEGALLLWPEHEGLYDLMRMRVESGPGSFEREKLSRPVTPEVCEWPAAYFDDTVWFDDWPSALRAKTLALDPSKGRDDKRGDYSAFVMLGVDECGRLYVEADLARRPTPEIVARGVELFQRFRPDVFGIEANQFQDLLAADFADEFQRQGLLGCAPYPIDNRLTKVIRIRRLGPYLSNRRLRFKTRSPSTQLLVEQLQEFPAGAHDDGPDALEMALRLAIEFLAPPPADGLGDHLLL